MKSKQPPTAEECEQILKQKLEEINDDTGDVKTNFIASFALDLPNSPNIEHVDNDKLRDEAFYDATLEGVKQAKDLLIQCNIPYIRPNDMFAEMMKSEDQMERIRQDITEKKQTKEQNVARHKEKKELKEKPKQNVQKRPGQLMKPHKDPKQKRDMQQRKGKQGRK